VTIRARGRTVMVRTEEVSAPSVGDTLVSGEGNRRGQIVNLYETLGKRPYVMVVNWVDTGTVGLLFPGPDVYIHPAPRLPEDRSQH
jgi:hypothetical protein